MIDLLFIVFLIIFLVYHYTRTFSECNTAASTYLQIWTGSCGMACRHSGYSRFSGMSGLNQPARSPIEYDAPSSRCVCEACPCAFIENVLRRCQPVSDVYENHMDTISVYMAGIMQVISEAYLTIISAIDFQTSYQRQAQIVDLKQTYESNQNFTFGAVNTDSKNYERKKSIILPRINELAKKLTRSETALRKDVKINDKAGTSTEPKVHAAKSVQTVPTPSVISAPTVPASPTASAVPTSPTITAPTGPNVPSVPAVRTATTAVSGLLGRLGSRINTTGPNVPSVPVERIPNTTTEPNVPSMPVLRTAPTETIGPNVPSVPVERTAPTETTGPNVPQVSVPGRPSILSRSIRPKAPMAQTSSASPTAEPTPTSTSAGTASAPNTDASSGCPMCIKDSKICLKNCPNLNKNKK